MDKAGQSFPGPEYSPRPDPQQVGTDVGKRSLASAVDRAQTAGKASEIHLARPGTVRTAGEQAANVEECAGNRAARHRLALAP
jgi:hypothetical protein